MTIKERKTHKRHPSTKHSSPYLFTSTDNNIRERGTTSLSEALKSNTTLAQLYLSCEDKKKEDTQKTFINNSLFSFLSTSTDNGIGDTGATALSEGLKSNTTLSKLDLSGQDKKKEDTQKTSINNSHFLFLFT